MAYYTEDDKAAELSDETLMSRAAFDDMRALELLVRRYQGPLFAYVRRILGNASDAEDVFQETFLRVHTHRKRFRTTGKFRPWVYCIATNLCNDRLRYRQRHPVASLDTASGSEHDRTLEDTVANGKPGPDDMARRGELAARLELAVNALPVKQRMVFLMARYDGMPYDEIAGVLGLPVGTVKSRMNAATQFLMDRLSEFKP